jgi:hypothetical protein
MSAIADRGPSFAPSLIKGPTAERVSHRTGIHHDSWLKFRAVRLRLLAMAGKRAAADESELRRPKVVD